MSPVLSRVAGAQGGIINNSGFRRAYLGRSVAAYNISRSLRFNSGDSANLSRDMTTASSTYTFSAWVKLSQVSGGTFQYIFASGPGGLAYHTNKTFYVFDDSTVQETTAVFRDPSAWYHIVFSVNSLSFTLYVNNVSVKTGSAIALSTTAGATRIGVYNGTGSPLYYFNGYLADIHFIDGSALTPSSFGETDATTGVWVPIEPDGLVYGTNGFHLDFADTSASTATALGKDTSGNGNNWTPNNFTVIGYTAPSSATISSVSTESLAVTTYQVRRGSGSRTGTPPQSWSTATNMGDQTINVGSNFNPSAPGVINWGSGDWLYFKLNTSSVALIGLLTTGNGPMRLYGSSNGSSWTLVYAGDNGSRLAQSTTPYEYYAWCMQDQVVAANDYGVNGPRTLVTVSANTNLTKFNLVNYVTQSNSGATGYIATLDTNSFIFGLLFTTGTWASNGTNTVIGPSTLNTTGAVDTLRDSPTNGTQSDTGVGGEVVGNYCTWNPLCVTTNNTLGNGNLEATHTASTGWTGNSRGTNYAMFVGTMGVTSGKWYWEGTFTSATTGSVGIVNNGAGLQYYVGYDPKSAGYSSTYVYNNGFGSAVGSMPSFAQNDIIGVAIDMDNGKLYFSVNGTFINSGNPAAGTGNVASGLTGETVFPAVSQIGSSDGISFTANFGQRAFAYTAPSGFKALCTANLPAPTIVKPSTVMDVALYSANGSTQTISGFNFSPDLVWSKSRNRAYPHGLHDSVRGAYKYLRSNGTNAETDTSGDSAIYTLTSFNSDGFSVGADGGAGVINNNAAGATTYAAWCWDAGSSTVTNTSGSITSSVRANATAGFSVVTGNFPSGDSSGTIGHGLGVKPGLIFLKSRVSAEDWFVHHSALAANQALLLNSTVAIQTSTTYWNNQLPTSTVFSIGNALSNGNFVAYCFAPVSGYSSFGSYTGNGSSDGPFVYTGFRPRFVLWKASSGLGSWYIHDTARSTYNLTEDGLFPNLSDAENNTFSDVDILSNGFKQRNAGAAHNGSGATYIYAAFAESPLNYARAR